MESIFFFFFEISICNKRINDFNRVTFKKNQFCIRLSCISIEENICHKYTILRITHYFSVHNVSCRDLRPLCRFIQLAWSFDMNLISWKIGFIRHSAKFNTSKTWVYSDRRVGSRFVFRWHMSWFLKSIV